MTIAMSLYDPGIRIGMISDVPELFTQIPHPFKYAKIVRRGVESFEEVIGLALTENYDVVIIGEFREPKEYLATVNALQTHGGSTTFHACDLNSFYVRLQGFEKSLNVVFTEPPFQLLTSLLFYYVYDEESKKRIKVRACEGVFLVDKWSPRLRVEPIIKWDFDEQTYRLNENALMKVYELISKATGLIVNEVQEFVNDFAIICELLSQAWIQNPIIDTFIEDKLLEAIEFRGFTVKLKNGLG